MSISRVEVHPRCGLNLKGPRFRATVGDGSVKGYVRIGRRTLPNTRGLAVDQPASAGCTGRQLLFAESQVHNGNDLGEGIQAAPEVIVRMMGGMEGLRVSADAAWIGLEPSCSRVREVVRVAGRRRVQALTSGLSCFPCTCQGYVTVIG